jgi:HEAT repeat protein
MRKDEGRTGLPWKGVTAIVYAVPEAIPTIVKEMNSPNYRGQVAYYLGRYATNATDSIPFLKECAKDEDWRVRYQSMVALRSFGAEAMDAEPLIRSLMGDSNSFVAEQAQRTLESLRPVEAERPSE